MILGFVALLLIFYQWKEQEKNGHIQRSRILTSSL
jgi:hypothetical protein